MKRDIKKNIFYKNSFGIEGFDYRLLPLVLPSAPDQMLIVFDDALTDCYDNLSLFLENQGVFVNKDLLEGSLAPAGFSGWSGIEKARFLSSLSSGFVNHKFILIPFSLYGSSLFPNYRVTEEVRINEKTSYDSLLSLLLSITF